VFSKQSILHPYPIHASGACAVLSGENRYYSRAMVDGVAYVTTGGAGAALDTPVMPSDSVVTAVSAHHFLRLELAGDSLAGTAIRTDGAVIERFVVRDVTGVAAGPGRTACPRSNARGFTRFDLSGRVDREYAACRARVVMVPGAGLRVVGSRHAGVTP
jgi:hypothetical protein